MRGVIVRDTARIIVRDTARIAIARDTASVLVVRGVQ